MTEKEKLYEQYEDAFFALLMHEVAEAEGEALIEKNKQLQSDPDAAVPEIVTERCLHLIEKNEQKSKRQQTAKHAVRILSRVAMVILVPILLFAGVFAASETVRVKTLNFLMEELDVGTAFLFQSEDDSQHDSLPDILNIALEHIPDGFSLVSNYSDRIQTSYLFQNDVEAEIEVTSYQLQNEAGTAVIDTENADVEYEEIRGQNIMIVHKKTSYQIVWVCQDQQYMIIVLGIDVLLDDLMPIVENLIP